jgi:hypothetical protein
MTVKKILLPLLCAGAYAGFGAVTVSDGVMTVPGAGAFSALVTGDTRAALEAGKITRIVKTGKGELILDQALADYRGEWDLADGVTLVAVPGNAFGAGAVTVKRPAQLKVQKGVEAVLAGPLAVKGGDPHWKAVYMDEAELTLLAPATVEGGCNLHFQGGKARLRCKGGFEQRSGTITTTGANGIWSIEGVPAHFATVSLTWLYLDLDIAGCSADVFDLAIGGKLRLKGDVTARTVTGGEKKGCAIIARWPCSFALTGDGDVALCCDVSGPIAFRKTGKGTLTSVKPLPGTFGTVEVKDGVLSMTVGPEDDLVNASAVIRAYLASGKLAADRPVTVTLTPGTYTMREPITLGQKDSGTEKAPVVWRAEKRGTVRVFGGKAIPRSSFGPVTEPAARARLDPAVRDKVLVADATPYLVKEPAAWPDHPTGVMPGPWLYHNRKSQTLARWPNLDAPDNGWSGYSNVLANCGYGEDKRAKAPATIEFPGTRAERWNFAEGVWITGYLVVDWHCDTVRIASYDKATHGATLTPETSYGVGKGGWPFYKRRFFVQNLLEELDQEEEWYLDRKAKKLYWWPPPAEGADEIVLAQALVPYFKMEKAAFVRVENLDFEYSHDGTAVVMKGCRQCLVKNCGFFNHGGAAVVVDGGTRNRVTECEMRNMGGTVVMLQGGNCRTLLPANNMIDHCVIDNFAMYKRTHGVGISMGGCGNAVRDNVITHSPDCALSYSGNEHLIANNEFGHIAQDSGDVGCIYSGHHANWLGTIIFGNYIHDLARTTAESGARNGIYFDDCDWGDDVIGNTFLHAGRAIFIGGGKLHGAYNNLVKECLVGVHCDSRGRSWRATGNGSFFWDKKGKAFCRYRHTEEGIEYDYAPWCVAYPALREAMDDRPEYPGMNTITGNVFYACKTVYGYDSGAVRVLGKSSPGNTVITKAARVPTRAPQPIQMKDAVTNLLTSPDGTTVARLGMDESGHFAWTLMADGRYVLDRSPLGVTVDYFDYGRKVVPCAAELRGEVQMNAYTNATALTPIRGGIAWRNINTNVTDAVGGRTAKEWRIPVKSLITAETVAFLDVRVWKGGAAYRWTVPGKGVRKVYGENGAFIPYDGDMSLFQIVEWERDEDFENGYPESFYYERGGGRGISFPEYAHGWRHAGDVVTPWRGVLCTVR